MTPYEAGLLIHFSVMATEFEQSDTQLFKDTVAEWLKLRVIEDSLISRNPYATTKLGRAWLEDMLNTPIPKVRFVGRNGIIIMPNN